MALFLDNCSIHRAKLVTAALARTKFQVLWNLPYRPDLNAIELVWAIAKRTFRAALTRDLLDFEREVDLS